MQMLAEQQPGCQHQLDKQFFAMRRQRGVPDAAVRQACLRRRTLKGRRWPRTGTSDVTSSHNRTPYE